MANCNIFDSFNEYFEMVPASSDELRNEAYKLRYQVFCIENNFESTEQFPDEMEIDDYDRHSAHFLIRHRKSGDYAATVRLILPDTDNPDTLFPLEVYCEIENPSILQFINRKSLGETSRFCVSKAFKQRKHEAHTIAALGFDWEDYFTPEEERSFPLISFALIACVVKACHDNRVNYIFGTLEPAWFRYLSASGIKWTKIGPLADYHGERWPCLIKPTDLIDGVAKKNPDLWNFITDNGRLIQANRPSVNSVLWSV